MKKYHKVKIIGFNTGQWIGASSFSDIMGGGGRDFLKWEYGLYHRKWPRTFYIERVGKVVGIEAAKAAVRAVELCRGFTPNVINCSPQEKYSP